MDFIERLPKSKRKSVIWVVVDRLTKYTHFISLSHPYSAHDITKLFMENIYKLHGMPGDITSDKDPIFTSKIWQELFSIMGVNFEYLHCRSPPKQMDRQKFLIDVWRPI